MSMFSGDMGFMGPMIGGAAQTGMSSGFNPWAMAAGAGLGLLGGKESQEQRNRPIKQWIEPPEELGGWAPLQQSMDWMELAYHPSNWYTPFNPALPSSQMVQDRGLMDLSNDTPLSPWGRHYQQQPPAQSPMAPPTPTPPDRSSPYG